MRRTSNGVWRDGNTRGFASSLRQTMGVTVGDGEIVVGVSVGAEDVGVLATRGVASGWKGEAVHETEPKINKTRIDFVSLISVFISFKKNSTLIT